MAEQKLNGAQNQRPFERFSVITFNVWNIENFTQRQAALQAFLQTFQPDVYCLQEVCPDILTLFDKELRGYDRIKEDPFQGWTHGGNIYWNSQLLSYVSHGAVDLGLAEPSCRLFWVKLRSIQTGWTMIISNCHYTWEGHPTELETSITPRINLALKTAQWLKKVQDEKGVNAVIFAGDLNDRYHPRRVLRQVAGYIDSFSQIKCRLKSTWPTPSFSYEEDSDGGVDHPCDWIFSRPDCLKVISSQIIDFAHNFIFPSDHFPVQAILQTLATNPSDPPSQSVNQPTIQPTIQPAIQPAIQPVIQLLNQPANHGNETGVNIEK